MEQENRETHSAEIIGRTGLRTSRGRSIRRSLLGALLAAPLIACAGGALAQTEPPPPSVEHPQSRVQINLTAGMVLPSQFTPEIVFPTYTGVGPYVRVEATYTLLRHLELGGYLSVSDHPLASVHCGSYCTSGAPSGEMTGSEIGGGVLLVSGGAIAKLRFDPASWATVRIGMTVGANYIGFPLQDGGGMWEKMPGEGLELGFDADFRAQLADHFALVAKIGFLAQPVGTAKFPDDTSYPGKSVGFAVPPTGFVGVGPEVFF